jgi:hypothetical protein
MPINMDYVIFSKVSKKGMKFVMVMKRKPNGCRVVLVIKQGSRMMNWS